ncbi:hypothetical protein ACT691_18025 [Vibrio metschnikovii]
MHNISRHLGLVDRFYQIFPDRFANGKTEISVKSGEYSVSGGSKPVIAKAWEKPVDNRSSNAALWNPWR